MTPAELLARLDKDVVLLDGGMGSLLIGMGLTSGCAPERWNLEHPDRIVAAHRQYVEAGSDAIQTNTFGGNPAKLETAGLGGRCAEVNKIAVDLVRQASKDAVLVAGDIGPTGKMLKPVGNATEEELSAIFTEQVEALAQAGVDFFSIETMYDLREAKCALQAARSTNLPVVTSMTFDAKKRGFFTMMGDPIGSSLRALEESGATVVGLNCSVDARTMKEMVEEAKTFVSCPLVAQPNAGQPRPTEQGVTYDVTPDSFAEELMAIVQAGARVVGGCCGTDPGCIRAARRALDGAKDE